MEEKAAAFSFLLKIYGIKEVHATNGIKRNSK